jgi:hypothetical protein
VRRSQLTSTSLYLRLFLSTNNSSLAKGKYDGEMNEVSPIGEACHIEKPTGCPQST